VPGLTVAAGGTVIVGADGFPKPNLMINAATKNATVIRRASTEVQHTCNRHIEAAPALTPTVIQTPAQPETKIRTTITCQPRPPAKKSKKSPVVKIESKPDPTRFVLIILRMSDSSLMILILFAGLNQLSRLRQKLFLSQALNRSQMDPLPLPRDQILPQAML